MIPHGVMPHPWWQLWQIGDFLIMLAVVVFFVRFMRRSDAQANSEEAPERDEEERPAQSRPAASTSQPGDDANDGDRRP